MFKFQRRTKVEIVDCIAHIAAIVVVLLVSLFLVSRACGEEGDSPPFTRTHITSDAVNWAASDISLLPQADRFRYRYLYIPAFLDRVSLTQQVSFAINTAASQSSLIHHPDSVALSNGFLLRIDLSKLAPEQADFIRLAATWDATAATDPYFYSAQKIKVETPPYQARLPDGRLQTFRFKYIEAFGFAPHIPADAAALLIASIDDDPTDNRFPFPVARADRFISLMLSTIDGGRYYDFLQLDRNPARGTERDALFRRLGANESFSQDNSGDRRVGIKESGVTGKPRQVEYVRGLAGRQSEGRIFVTFDIADGDVSLEFHPIYNLLSFDHRAEEIIWERPNGLHGFALFDAAGNLQDEAPPDVARDHHVPSPHTARLQSGISCIQCHGPDDGLKDAPNDVRRILSGRLNIFDDLSLAKIGKSREEVAEILAGRFAGDFEKLIRRGRDDYAEATFRATSIGLGFPGQTIPAISQGVSETYGRLRYERVTPRQALLEWGVSVPVPVEGNPEVSAKEIANLVLPDPQPNELGISFEQLTIGELKEGEDVRRTDFEREYASGAFRIQQFFQSQERSQNGGE